MQYWDDLCVLSFIHTQVDITHLLAEVLVHKALSGPVWLHIHRFSIILIAIFVLSFSHEF